MNVVIIGLKNHPYTIRLLNRLKDMDDIFIYLLQPAKIEYDPKEIASLLKYQENSESSLIDKHSIMLFYYNPIFTLKTLFYLYVLGNTLKVNPYMKEWSSDEKLLENNIMNEKYVKNINGSNTISWLKKINPDIMVLASNTGILKKDILKIPKIGTINAHPGILPKYRGMDPVEYSILNNDEVGITTYFLDTGIDTGKILFIEKISYENVSYEQLKIKINNCMIDSLIKALILIKHGDYKEESQKYRKGLQYFPIHDTLLKMCIHKLTACAP